MELYANAIIEMQEQDKLDLEEYIGYLQKEYRTVINAIKKLKRKSKLSDFQQKKLDMYIRQQKEIFKELEEFGQVPDEEREECKELTTEQVAEMLEMPF